MQKALLVFIGLLFGVLGAPRIDFSSSGRIVNGTDAEEGEYPFMASLRVFDGFEDAHICGTSIVSRFYTVTAGHCVYGNGAGGLIVLVGTIYQSQGGIRHHVDYHKTHENFNYPDPENDIAVVKLATPITFSDVIQPAKLPAQNQVTPGGTPATVIGWGYQYDYGEVAEHLQKVDITVYSDEECDEIHYSVTFPSNICAGVPEGGKGQCSGDSGGPLIVNGEVVGLVSWSIKPCAVAPYPGVYTEVSYFVDWIEANTIDPANQTQSS